MAGGSERKTVLLGLAVALLFGIAVYLRLWTIDYTLSSDDTERLRGNSYQWYQSESRAMGTEVIEIPIFYGEDPESWVAWMDEFFFSQGFSEFERQQFAYGFIEGEAHIWYCDELSRSAFLSWDDLKLRLLHRFGRSFEDTKKQEEPSLKDLWRAYLRLVEEDKAKKRSEQEAMVCEDSNQIVSPVGGYLRNIDPIMNQIQRSSEEKKPEREEIHTSKDTESVVREPLKGVDQILCLGQRVTTTTESTIIEEGKEPREHNQNRKKKRKRWKKCLLKIWKFVVVNRINGKKEKTSMSCGNEWFGFDSTERKVTYQLEREKLREAKNDRDAYHVLVKMFMRTKVGTKKSKRKKRKVKRDKCADQVLDKMLLKQEKVMRKRIFTKCKGWKYKAKEACSEKHGRQKEKNKKIKARVLNKQIANPWSLKLGPGMIIKNFSGWIKRNYDGKTCWRCDKLMQHNGRGKLDRELWLAANTRERAKSKYRSVVHGIPRWFVPTEGTKLLMELKKYKAETKRSRTSRKRVKFRKKHRKKKVKSCVFRKERGDTMLHELLLLSVQAKIKTGNGMNNKDPWFYRIRLLSLTRWKKKKKKSRDLSEAMMEHRRRWCGWHVVGEREVWIINKQGNELKVYRHQWMDDMSPLSKIISLPIMSRKRKITRCLSGKQSRVVEASEESYGYDLVMSLLVYYKITWGALEDNKGLVWDDYDAERQAWERIARVWKLLYLPVETTSTQIFCLHGSVFLLVERNKHKHTEELIDCGMAAGQEGERCPNTYKIKKVIGCKHRNKGRVVNQLLAPFAPQIVDEKVRGKYARSFMVATWFTQGIDSSGLSFVKTGVGKLEMYSQESWSRWDIEKAYCTRLFLEAVTMHPRQVDDLHLEDKVSSKGGSIDTIWPNTKGEEAGP